MVSNQTGYLVRVATVLEGLQATLRTIERQEPYTSEVDALVSETGRMLAEPEQLPIGFLIRWNCPHCGCDNSVMPASWNKIIRADSDEPMAYEYGGTCFDCMQEVTLKLLVIRGTEEEPPVDPRDWADSLAMLTEREVRQLVLRMAGLLDSYAGKGRGEVDARIGDQVAQILMRRPQGR